MAKKKTKIEEKVDAKAKSKKDKVEVAETKEKPINEKVEKVETKVKSLKEKVEKENATAKKSATKVGKTKAITQKPPTKEVAKSPKPKSKAKVATDSKQKVENTPKVSEEKAVEAPAKAEVAETKVVEKNESNKKDETPIVYVFDPNVRYSDEELQEFSVLINQEKETALDELRMLKERLDDLTSFDAADESMIYSMHMGEQGSEAQEKEKTYAQIQRIHEYIKKLEEAMERIKNKTYGICRVCGCLIAKERLRAVPITTLSASYKIHQKCPEDGVDKIEPVKK